MKLFMLLSLLIGTQKNAAISRAARLYQSTVQSRHKLSVSICSYSNSQNEGARL